MTRSCDILVIGAGPGGYVAAIRAAQLGKKVILAERDRLGGECLNWGCIPSKALIHAGNMIYRLGEASEWGLTVKGLSLDLKKLQGWKQKVVDRLTSGIGVLCKGNGVEILPDPVRFVSENSVEIEGSPSKETIEFKQCIIATGGRPSGLPGLEIDGKRIITSKEALELREIPKDLVVVGGGVTGLEIGTFYAKMKSKVVVVELMEQLLPGTDPDAVGIVSRKLRRLGVEVHTSSMVKGWREKDGRLTVTIQTPEGIIEAVGDHILVTVGRKANTDGLGIEKTKVALDRKDQIIVDRQMRTNVPHIFAIGDVTGPPFLAHRASKQGIVAAEVAAGKNSEADFRAMPSAIFTDPEIAVVGLGEKEASDTGFNPKVGKVPFTAVGRALTEGASEGFVKLICDERTKLVLGAVIVGANASDLISELSLAIELGATIEDLALTVHPHPTMPEGVMEAAEAALGQAIHVLNR